FWRFPGVESRLDVPALTGVAPDDLGILLNLDLNPEFNNPSGCFSYRHDFGEGGVVVFFLLLGGVSAWLFSRFREGRLSGLLLYPLLVSALLEMPRVPYLTGGRAFPALALLVGLALINWVTSWRLPRGPLIEEETV